MSRARRHIGFTEIDAARARRAVRTARISPPRGAAAGAWLNRRDASKWCGVHPRTFDKHIRPLVEVAPNFPWFPLERLEAFRRGELVGPAQDSLQSRKLRDRTRRRAAAPPRTRRGSQIAAQMKRRSRRIDRERKK